MIQYKYAKLALFYKENNNFHIVIYIEGTLKGSQNNAPKLK